MPNSEDVSSWRFASNGGIPYRFLGLDGSIDPESAAINYRVLIQAENLLPLARELFPEPEVTGLMYAPRGGTMPGVPNLFAQRMKFTSQQGIDKPFDAFQADAAASAGTYHGFLECNIEFLPSNISNETDPSDPRTFLEISANETGDYLYIGGAESKTQEETVPDGENDTPGNGGVDAETGEANGNITTTTDTTNRHPNLPASIMVPKTEWSLKWKQIPYAYFRDTLVHRLRLLRGRVNSTPVPILYNSPAETLLMTGFTYGESYTWRDGNIATPPIDVVIKVVEKSVIWNGVNCGHNHVWVPGAGWRRLKIGPNKDQDPHRQDDFNFLFQV